MSSQFKLKIAPDGSLTAIYSDELSDLLHEGEATVQRVSHVEPVNQNGSTAWRADLSPVEGPVLGPFPLRAQALAAEVRWLEEHLF